MSAVDAPRGRRGGGRRTEGWPTEHTEHTEHTEGFLTGGNGVIRGRAADGRRTEGFLAEHVIPDFGFILII